ncbi:MAG: hypothetical protein QW279_07480 [Candidatus Jordarchaeaceae archaeon]
MEENELNEVNVNIVKTTPIKEKRKHILKSGEVVVKQKIVLNTEECQEGGALQLLKDGSIIKGVKYVCQCGREITIYFEYE